MKDDEVDEVRWVNGYHARDFEMYSVIPLLIRRAGKVVAMLIMNRNLRGIEFDRIRCQDRTPPGLASIKR